MEKKKKIEELRAKLDKSLASPDLVNPISIRSLVKNHLIRSGVEGNIDGILDKRTNEVSKFLEMLRSASGNEETNDWKLKQDTEQLRVLYREDPSGAPFHTLLVEGFADGPADVCLCVSWETTLYKKWWPQYNFPSFKIIASDLLKRIRVGEEISLIRMKVPWPVSDREALLHYFEIEFLQEDLVLVLLNTISDAESIDINTHGFTGDGIPKANGTVRIDLIGGFVLQKVNDQKSYFRAIANMDIKLDFVPPSLINFIARQLIGNGHKLYQKAIGTVATSDDDYKKALNNALYMRIRNSMNTIKKQEISQYSISTVTNGTSISEIEQEEEEEEEWYDAIDEINNDQMENNYIQMRNELQSIKSVNTVSEASSSVYANGDSNVSTNSSRDLRQTGNKSSTFSKEKNRKVGDEGTLKNNEFNDKNSNKKKKNKKNKWYRCIGRSAVAD
ncbi:hypothetical protein LUZ60_002022 [Juncus effusus]|nr:hypothetical protein LUZ60_002022 [Juncus effusus]